MELLELLEDVVGGHVAAGFEPVRPPGGVGIADGVQLAGGDCAVERVGAQRLQQPVAGLATETLVGDDEALVDEPADEVEHGVDDPTQRRPDITLAREASAGSRPCPCGRAWSAPPPTSAAASPSPESVATPRRRPCQHGPMRYVLVGAGAIGGLLGARMTQAGHDVTLVARGAHLEAMRDPGAARRDAGGQRGGPRAGGRRGLAARRRGRRRPSRGEGAGHPRQALEQVRATGGAGAAIVCLQNGVVNERIALRRFADVYGVVVFCPATHLEPGVVAASGVPLHGVLDIGRFPGGVDDRAEEVAEAFSSARSCRSRCPT